MLLVPLLLVATIFIWYARRMRIITSGSRYLDIDAYAGIVAYAELLNQLGLHAEAVSTAPFNESIPEIVRTWQTPLKTEYIPNPSDTYTLIDVSEPEFFESFVDHACIDEIIDHHPDFLEYWQERIGDNALIEHVGAACTQVYEQWEQAGLAEHISETSARLLMCGILDNTLNFGADITTDRDKHAYTELSKYADLPDDWPAQYFSACQASIMDDVANALANDTKTINFKSFPRPLAVGQLAIWDAHDATQHSFSTFKSAITASKPDWFLNIISMHDNKSYLVTDVPEVQAWLQDTLGVQFGGNIAAADRPWLRKEIIKADIVRASDGS
jgi:inorganic pyrophosphatase/exopolyphosphatase